MGAVLAVDPVELNNHSKQRRLDAISQVSLRSSACVSLSSSHSQSPPCADMNTVKWLHTLSVLDESQFCSMTYGVMMLDAHADINKQHMGETAPFRQLMF